jgi:hypothetical protein
LWPPVERFEDSKIVKYLLNILLFFVMKGKIITDSKIAQNLYVFSLSLKIGFVEIFKKA